MRMQRTAACVILAAGLAGAARAETRSYDGSGNNLTNIMWGGAGTMLHRVGMPCYGDGVWTMGGQNRPSARVISNAINAQSGSIVNNRSLSDWAWQWGQFIDHDLDLTEGAADELEPIMVPIGDPFFDPNSTGTASIAFGRSVYDHSTGNAPGNPRRQTNSITTWVDGSMVYGSDQSRADGLRAFSGGRLRVSAHASGDLLPFNTTGLPNGGGPGANLFVAGDVRANEQAGLTAVHTLFVREHNRHAGLIAAANPGMSDEEVYQRARKIVGAEIQSITYNEWLPALLGSTALPAYTGYDAGVDPSIATEFSTALFRVGHTMLSPTLRRVDDNGVTIPQGDLALRDAFFNPANITNGGGVDPLLKGLASQGAQEIDAKVIDDVRNFLVGPFGPNAIAFDLPALNIQRGRDHGLADYNDVRAAYGLAPKASFADITSDTALASALELAYGDVNDIDLWVGALSEDHLPGSSLGELITVGIIEQFMRLRAGDRFWFENDPELADLASTIAGTTLADIIRLNSDITNIQNNVFFVPSPGVLALVPLCGACLALRRRRA